MSVTDSDNDLLSDLSIEMLAVADALLESVSESEIEPVRFAVSVWDAVLLTVVVTVVDCEDELLSVVLPLDDNVDVKEAVAVMLIEADAVPEVVEVDDAVTLRDGLTDNDDVREDDVDVESEKLPVTSREGDIVAVPDSVPLSDEVTLAEADTVLERDTDTVCEFDAERGFERDAVTDIVCDSGLVSLTLAEPGLPVPLVL